MTKPLTKTFAGGALKVNSLGDEYTNIKTGEKMLYDRPKVMLFLTMQKTSVEITPEIFQGLVTNMNSPDVLEKLKDWQ